jgi:predicted nucleic acid-binding protein
MRGVEIVPLSREIAESAGTLSPPGLRSIDAIHLASALVLRRHLAAFVAYDKRLLAAAGEAGLPTASPA